MLNPLTISCPKMTMINKDRTSVLPYDQNQISPPAVISDQISLPQLLVTRAASRSDQSRIWLSRFKSFAFIWLILFYILFCLPIFTVCVYVMSGVPPCVPSKQDITVLFQHCNLMSLVEVVGLCQNEHITYLSIFWITNTMVWAKLDRMAKTLN